MIYKILNRLLGWDYVRWRNYSSDGISRVMNDHDGTTYYVSLRYGRTIIKKAHEVLWLTCPSSKYLVEEKKRK